MRLIDLNLAYLNDLSKLWNRELGTDFPIREELLKQNSFKDENVLPKGSKIAIDLNGHIMGFIISKKVKEGTALIPAPTGWIQVLVVDSNFRNGGVGSALLLNAENALKESGAETIYLGGDPWHYFPGIPNQYLTVKKWFADRGYREIETVSDLLCELEQKKNTKLNGEPSINVLSIKEKQQFLTFLNKHFPGRWEYEAIQYFNQGGSGREFAIMKLKGDIIGFIRINDSRSPIIGPNMAWSPLMESPELNGGIGPLAVIENQRGNGYGLTLVSAGLQILKERGINTAVIDWTEKIDFYRKTGAEIWKSYSTFKKELP